MKLLQRLTLLAGSVALLVSCADSPAATAVRVNAVAFTSAGTTVRAGATLTLAVSLRDADGNAVENVAVYWSSSDAKIATVSNAGVVTALAPGEVTVAASALGKSATTRITVTDRDVATVQVSPAVTSVRIGTTTPLVAVALDADGKPLTRTITWTTSDASVVTVSAAGIVTGVSTGAATVTATSDGRIGTAAVTVTVSPVASVTVSPARDTLGVGSQVTLVASLRDASNGALTGRSVAWSSTDAQIATVSSTGIVTALAPGSVTISAVSEGRSGTAVVVVLARLASSVTLTPSTATLSAGSTIQLASQVTDPSGNLLNDRPISFNSDNNIVALVNATGLVTAVSPGTVSITATSEGKTGTATIVVTPVPVAAVTVSPATANLFVGGTVQLSAQALSDGGNVLPGRTVTWISGAPSVVTVSSSGLVTAVSAGTALVVAVVDGVAGSATITVRVRPVAAIAIAPLAPLIAVGTSLQLVPTVRDDAGGVLTNRAIIWRSSDDTIAFVSSAGLVVGIKAGTATITATSEGVIGSLVVSVR